MNTHDSNLGTPSMEGPVQVPANHPGGFSAFYEKHKAGVNLVGIGASILVLVLGAIYFLDGKFSTVHRKFDEKIGTVAESINENSTKLATMDERTKNIKEDIAEIKTDIDNIEEKLNHGNQATTPVKAMFEF